MTTVILLVSFQSSHRLIVWTIYNQSKSSPDSIKIVKQNCNFWLLLVSNKSKYVFTNHLNILTLSKKK